MLLPSSISTRIQYQHKSLLELIDGLSDEQIRMAVLPGKWSIFEQIVHLETYQHLFIHRIRQMQEQSGVAFQTYNAEADPLFHEHLSKSSREIIQDLLTTRKEMASGIEKFDDKDLEKKAYHSVYGGMNMISWLNFFLLHEAHHLFAIFKLAASIRAGHARQS